MAADSEKFSPRLSVPRLAPIGKEGRTPEQEKMLASRPDYNIYKTLAHHPELYTRWSGMGQYLLNGSTLPPRDREIIILRMGWLCQAPYEWSQHARIAQADVKMTAAEVHRIAEGGNAKEWCDFER
ncbi:MAG TPA: carboxymuconolactone decarboxylase family protein, partial [Steroidobacteraceae bacterium]|nr:carboxymuconolactone decarboxylase family protein [Steroidobacteraceae bacterium]